MADVRRADDRGQLIIVAGLVLAVILVSLALILNTAIFTENLATRGSSDSNEAVQISGSIDDGVGGIIEAQNAGSAGADYTSLEGDFESSELPAYASQVNRQAALDGRSVSVSIAQDGGTPLVASGTRIVDDGTGSTAFYPAYGSPSRWTVAKDVTARGFRIVVDGTLDEEDTSDVIGDNAADDYFYVEVTDQSGSVTNRVAIYDAAVDSNGPDIDPTVAVYDADSGTVTTCSGGSLSMEVDLSRGTVDGQPCPALQSLHDLAGPYTIEYVNPDQIAGTYELTVDRYIDGGTDEAGAFTDEVDAANDPSGNNYHCEVATYYGASAGNAPYVAPALYSAEVVSEFESKSVEYVVQRRVAPGEVGNQASAPQIVTFDVTADNSDEGNDDVEFVFNWEVAHPDPSASMTVKLVVTNLDSVPMTSETETLDGSATSGEAEVGEVYSESSLFTFIGSDRFSLTLVVSDGTTTRTVTQTHRADGDMTECPP